MRKSIKLQLEQSELREKINPLLNKESLSDEERADLGKMTKRMQEIEVELRAALVAEGETEERARAEFTDANDTPEARELSRITDAASVGAIFSAALEHRTTDGETAELQAHLGLAPNQVPLVLLRQPIEHRAVTPAPGNVGRNMQPIIPAVFPQSVAAFLGVDMPTVPVGDAVFPVLSTSADVRVPDENAAAAETTGAFTADVLQPSRLQASFFYSRESAARFAGMDAALRQNLGDALADKLDERVVAGSAGLLAANVLTNHNVNAKTTYALYRSQLAYGRVDGKYAGSVGDIRVVMGAATYGHAASQFRSDNAGDRAALEDLQSVTGGVRVSAHVTAVVNNKQNAIVRLGMRRDMVAPVWQGVTLIPDEVTLAANGQIKVTAVMLYAVKVLRAAGFWKQQTQHA
ncbi:MAG: hypothetical protein OXQ29_08440 [Rhodospirillaceae bacterium]|nr:hypothetical protein [Rhodospirillaceae bacterium]